MTTAPPLTERQFQTQVRELFGRLGWTHIYHTYDSRRSDIGFVDLVLVHPKHGILFAEIKTDKGRTTPEQDAWIDAINVASAAHGGPRIAVVWRPSDWDRIVDIAQRGLRHIDST